MGGNLSTNMEIQLDRHPTPYCAGEFITGQILIQVDSGFSAKGLEYDISVRLSGQEYTSAMSRDADTSHTSTEKFSLVAVEKFLATLNGQALVSPQLELPFSIEVPAGLPGSQGIREKHHDHFCIEYFLRAVATRSGSTRKDFVTETKIVLSGPVYTGPKTPSSEEAAVVPIAISICCWCIPNGYMTVGLNTDNTNPSLGETMKVEFSLKNESSSTIKAVEIKLSEALEFVADGTAAHRNRCLVRNRIEASELDSASLVKSPQTTYQSISKDTTESKRQVDITVPSSARHSYVGRLGKVRHYLSIKVVTTALVKNTITTLPITIHSDGKSTEAGEVREIESLQIEMDEDA
ncbi:hypothetical protein EON65_03305 [archaeon]|nr:MAG: hypothetical protein EON65_03305 [archaeon]